MQITIVAVGKIKEKFMMQAIGEYKKRLGRYCKLNIIEIADEKAPENLGVKQREQLKETEGQKILPFLKDKLYVIALDIQGEPSSSEGLAEKIRQLGLRGDSNLVFVIGGSLGLSAEIINKADFRLSLSPLTFPHQLTRLILLEQIYRSFKIIK
ncbi:MAG: 23S rRNA (pseudouridine(1915)-N(3))-methyltransferase RlmH, partial [Bacillota bacterium]